MPSKAARIPRTAIKIDLPDTRQRLDYTCGASCFQAIAGYFGVVGPDWEEEDFVSVMGMPRDGSDPHHIIRGIKDRKLSYRETWPMSDTQLQAYLDRGIPVMMMIQAWHDPSSWRRKRRWPGYKHEWNDGHWVAAIGNDRQHVFFEDPSLVAARGYLTWRELDDRWHDVGPKRRPPHEPRMHRYGVAIWRKPIRKSSYRSRAFHID